MEHYQHTRHFNLRTPRRSRAPYTQGPPPPDADGQPWCDCCTAYLSEDDNTQQGPPPTHSNLYRDYLRIFRSNENYQNDQRSSQYKTIARTTGNHTTPHHITPHHTTPHPNPPLHTPTPTKWLTSRTASPTSSSNHIAEEAAASAKPNTTCAAQARNSSQTHRTRYGRASKRSPRLNRCSVGCLTHPIPYVGSGG
jgi:hypothetical protein